LEQTDLYTPENQASYKLLEELDASPDKVFFKAHETALRPGFMGMNAFYFHSRVSSIDGYFNPQRYSSHRRVLDLTPNLEGLLRLAGVSHFICSGCRTLTTETVENSFEFPPYRVYTLRHIAYPTVFEEIPKNKNPFKLTSPDGGLLPVAGDVEKLRELLEWRQTASGVTTEANKTNYKRYQVSVARPSLFAPDIFYSKNWKVRVNGKHVKTDAINVLRQAVKLAPGTHLVEVTYRPDLLLELFVATAAGIAIFLGTIFVPRSIRLSTWR
jgi:hypothetical protein